MVNGQILSTGSSKRGSPKGRQVWEGAFRLTKSKRSKTVMRHHITSIRKITIRRGGRPRAGENPGEGGSAAGLSGLDTPQELSPEHTFRNILTLTHKRHIQSCLLFV